MQRRNQQTPKASWRKSTRQASARAAVTPEFGSQGRSRRKLVFKVSALATLAISLIMMLILVFWRTPDRDVPLIAAAVTRSSADCFIPVSPCALEDIQRWKNWFQNDTDRNIDNQHVVFQGEVDTCTGEMAEVTSGTSTTGGLIRQLTTQGIEIAIPGGPDDDMVALSVTAQGLVDQGKPYLLVGNSRPDDPGSWVSVESLFTAIHNSLEKKNVRAVLFLDANRVGTVWDWGKLDNTFASTCTQLAEDVQDRLAIILACEDGERSWWDPKQGHSLFAQAILEAFAGHRAVDRDGNGITVGEIETFLRSQVRSYARSRWDASQHPILLTKSCRDWDFIATPSWPERIDDQQATNYRAMMTERYAIIDQLWQRHNAARDQTTHNPLATDPLRWSLLEKRLARLDQLAITGAGSTNEFSTTVSACDNLLTQFELGPVAVRAESFPEIRLGEYFHTLNAHRNADFLDVFDEWSKTADVNNDLFLMKEDQDREVKLSSALWDWLRDDQRHPNASVAVAEELLEENRIGDRISNPVTFLETHLIRLLAAEDLGHVGKDYSDRILQLHDKSRKLVFPRDIRAVFWIRSAANELDVQRMTLIDRMLGQGESADIAEDWQEINRRLDRLTSVADEISQAYLLRDQMLHNTPRIVETLLGDPGAFDEGPQIARLVREATEATRALEQSLHLVPSIVASTRMNVRGQAAGQRDGGDQYRRAAENAKKSLGALQTILNNHANVSIQSAGAGAGFRQAISLLAGSGLSQAKLRSGLHARVLMVAEAMPDLEIERDGESSPDRDQEDARTVAMRKDDPRYLIDGWHPWVYWLQRVRPPSHDPNEERESSRTTESLIAQGQRIRAEIDRLQTESFTEVGQIPEQLSSTGRLAEVRRDVEALDTRLRTRLFVLDRRDEEVDEATSDRFKLDVQLFLMDHARRTIEEFWCESQPGERPYFVNAAKSLLDIEAFWKLKSRTLDGVILPDQLEDRNEIIKNGDTLLSRSNRRSKELESIKKEQSVRFSFPIPEFLPSGRVTVFGDPKQRQLISTKPRGGDTNGATEGASEFDIAVPESLSKDNSKFVVSSFFRGLRRMGGLNARVLGDPDTVVFELPSYGPPTAEVRAEKQHMNAILVFDCSRSMNVGRRMDEAKEAITNLIDKLPDESKVGLIMFGHRYMWRTKDNRMVSDPKKPDPRAYFTQTGTSMPPGDTTSPDNPNFDVEEVEVFQTLRGAGSGSSKNDHRSRLRNAIGDARPVGVTPTFQAISMAYDSLRRSGEKGHIIVLTDGEPNLQIIQSRHREPAIDRFKAAGPDSLSIINFANDSAQSDLRSVFPGRIFDAKTGELLRVLEGMIPAEQVTWNFADSTSLASEQEAFYSKVAINQWPPADANTVAGKLVEPARKYDINAVVGKQPSQPAPVRVHGGEAFLLQWNQNRLTHIPYVTDENQNTFVPLSVPPESKYAVYVGRARRDGAGTLNLQVVVENKNQDQFTPRPTDVWIDILPAGVDGDHQYSITIPEFVANEPVPVLKCRINNWPETSKATINVWIRSDGTLAQRQPLPIREDTPSSFAGAEVRVEQETDEHPDGNYHVIVTESYKDPADLNRLRVLPQPLPNKAMIQCYRASNAKATDASPTNLVKRTFHYREKPPELDLWVTEKDQITQGAIHARGELNVLLDQ